MSNFIPRLDSDGLSSSDYYNTNNPFYKSGWGLPNCTCYAWGRFWECQGVEGTRPTLSLNNAEDWWGYTADGYQRGNTPKVGAVICWRKGQVGNDSDGAGHVGIVEVVNDDGTIVTSESGHNDYYFRNKTRNPTPNWDGGDYTFQGFIYNPVVFDTGGTPTPTPKPVTGAINRPLTSEEMHQNAKYIWWFLGQRGWTANAVAGMLGNMEVESWLNPFIWEDLDEGDLEGGFGLVQWTPTTKLINWCNKNNLVYYEMDSQLLRIIWEQENENGQFSSADTPYNMTFTEYKNSKLSAYELGVIFLTCYEKPTIPDPQNRGENAEYWYEYISGIPINPITPIYKKKKRIFMNSKFAVLARRVMQNGYSY